MVESFYLLKIFWIRRVLYIFQKKHSTLSELIKHKILAPEEAKSLLKIATVRNPFDSLASLYFKQKLKYQPLMATLFLGEPLATLR